MKPYPRLWLLFGLLLIGCLDWQWILVCWGQDEIRCTTPILQPAVVSDFRGGEVIVSSEVTPRVKSGGSSGCCSSGGEVSSVELTGVQARIYLDQNLTVEVEPSPVEMHRAENNGSLLFSVR